MKNIWLVIPFLIGAFMSSVPGDALGKEDWVYAFYLASGEGFFREQNKNYLEICKGAETVKNGKILVFIDVEPGKGKINRLRLKRGTHVVEVKSCRKVEEIEIPALGMTTNQPVNLDSSDPEVMGSFFRYVRENYAASKYFFAVVSHGDTLINPASESINAVSISTALKNNRATVLALDMCYMGGVESIWELRRSADFIVAASTTLPLSVNDYFHFLQKAGSGNPAPEQMAAYFVDAYRDTYDRDRYPISIFAMETGIQFENFVNSFNRRAINFPRQPETFEKIRPTQSAKSNLYGTNADLLNALRAFDDSLGSELLQLMVSSYAINTNFSGPALFFPKDTITYEKHRTAYRRTGFAGHCPNWTKFLDQAYRKE